MKKLSAGQLRLIVALNFVIICLLIGLLWIVPYIEPSLQTSGNVEYSRARVGKISLNPHLGWELELLGSDQESVVFSYEYDDILYVFGNTLSSDFDFERPSIFLAMVDTFGKLSEDSFLYFGDDGDVLRSATLCQDGFLLAVEGADSPYLMTIGMDGSLIKKVASFTNSFEEIDRLVPYHDGWLLLTRPYNTNQNAFGLKCVFFDRNLSFKLSSLAQTAYSLESFEVVLFSDRLVVFCNAVTAFGTSYPSVVEFSTFSSAKVKVLELYAGRCAGFSIHDGEYLLLTGYQGSSFLKLDPNFEVSWTKQLSLNQALYFSELDDKHYIAFYRENTQIFDSSLNRISTIDAYTFAQQLDTLESTIFGTSFDSATGKNAAIITFRNGELGGGASEASGSNGKIILGQGENTMLTIGASQLYAIYVRNGNIIISTVRNN